MFTSRHVKHSRLLLRHARKYLRYKADRLSEADRGEIVSGMKRLRDALRERDRETVHSAADTLDKVSPREIAENASVMTVLAYGLANLEQPLPR